MGDWVGEESEYPWEQEALDHVRPFVQAAPGYWALQNFSFTSLNNRTRECDLLVVGPNGLNLVEIKSHPGTATNQGSTWYFERGRPVENPRALTEQKCKELKSVLDQAAKRAGVRLPRIWVTASAFLSARDLVCEFDDYQKQHVFGREGLDEQTRLPGIWSGLLGRPQLREGRLKPDEVARIGKLIRSFAMNVPREDLEVGAYRLERLALDEGPTWRDHLAEHTSLNQGKTFRARIYTAQAETPEQRNAIHHAAEREYSALSGISHPHIVGREYYDGNALAEGPAILFEHGKAWVRLDQYLNDKPDLDLDTRVSMIRQLADALTHAHNHRLYHRSLAARSVWVEERGRYPHLRVGDWQTASGPEIGSKNGASTSMRSLAQHLEPAAGLFLAPEVAHPRANKVHLDVFGLGAVAYAIVAGQAPADSMQDLHVRVGQEDGLTLQSRYDDIPDELNDLIYRATRFQPDERTESMQQFGLELDRVEEALASADDPDPLQAKVGEQFAEFKVKRVLGTGSTGRALLVETARQEEPLVLKVGLGPEESDRLAIEALQLRKCRSSLIIRAKSDVLELPHGRHGLLLEFAGESSLGDHLRRERLSVKELKRLAEDLFTILGDLETSRVHHRDIKPDNLGLAGVDEAERRLTLFDFSLSGIADTNLEAGTRGFLDPFLGAAGRDRYDDAAERYAVAATLHMMATGEAPETDESAGGRIRVAEDQFDPALRESLTEFFNRAFDPEASRRHEDRIAMRDAFNSALQRVSETDAFEVRLPDSEVRHDTPLRLTGLALDAVSAVEAKLKVTTVGEFLAKPRSEINLMRGVGRGERDRLIRTHQLWESLLAEGPALSGDSGELLPVDTIAGAFFPQIVKNPKYIEFLKLYFAHTDAQKSGALRHWLTDAEIVRESGCSAEEVEGFLDMAYGRLKGGKVKGIGKLQDSVIGFLEQHGRIMSLDRLASKLLADRGTSDKDMNDADRFAAAAASVRAVVLFEERRTDDIRFEVVTGDDGTWLAALSSSGDDEPTEDELRDWACALAAAAKTQVERVNDGHPLPTAAGAKHAFGKVKQPSPAPKLSDRDLFELACGATTEVGVTPRLELYPLDLPVERAVRIVGLTSRLEAGATFKRLKSIVLQRFPKLQTIQDMDQAGFERLLVEKLRLDVYRDKAEQGDEWLLKLRPRESERVPFFSSTGVEAPAADVEMKLARASEEGGFLALRTSPKPAPAIIAKLSARPEVTPIDVTALYLRHLRLARDARALRYNGKPTWATVLKADGPGASARARANLLQLNLPAWEAIRGLVSETGGIVMLHDAAPLARMEGGMDLLRDLIAAARERTAPFGLWLVCPMWNPSRSAALDGQNVGALEVDSEQLQIRSAYLAAS